MIRRRLLKPLPQSLRSVPLKFDYVSIMKLAQNASGTTIANPAMPRQWTVSVKRTF